LSIPKLLETREAIPKLLEIRLSIPKILESGVAIPKILETQTINNLRQLTTSDNYILLMLGYGTKTLSGHS